MIAEAGEAVAASAATRGSQEDGASSLHVTPTPNQHPSTVRRTQRSTPSPSARVSPYPLRERTPPQALSPLAAPVRRQARVSVDASSESGETEEADQHRLQLVVQPIVKDTVGQRDNSGKLLEVFAANGATFNDIKHKLWEKFSNRIKRIAVKQDEIWSDEDPTEAAWSRAMVFKWNTHLVSTAKSEQAWNRWVVSRRGDTVTLLIFEYGTGIPNVRALEAFMQSCIRPQHTDRSGAAAEASIREIVAQLQDIWGATYQGSAVAWQMWANAIMRNLDRSTWEAAVLEPPTATVEQLLQLVGGEAEQHLVNLTKSTRVALDIVDAAIADNRQLKRDWKAIGERMDNQAMVLQARRQTLEGMLADIPLPSATAVPDPMPRMVNVEDNEHQQ